MQERTQQAETAKNEWILSGEETNAFNRLKEQCGSEGKPMVLWGWKRDKIVEGHREPESRTIYFSGDLSQENGRVDVERSFFFLETRAKRDEIQVLLDQVGESREVADQEVGVSAWEDSEYKGYARLRLTVGEANEYDRRSVERRLKGKPRLTIPEPRIVPEHPTYDLSALAPFDLCVGSGLSAESGLPLLGSIHNLFEVDNLETGQLIFGANDNLPARMILTPNQEIRKFCQFTVDAVKAQPSHSHLMIADLYQSGVVRQVFTDNLDDILAKVNVPYTRTRRSIFPDRYKVQFDPDAKSLLVIGVAVDRRDVIKQARGAGLNIVAVNPVFGVSPHSRNMDYLSKGDIFFRETSSEALPKIIEASSF